MHSRFLKNARASFSALAIVLAGHSTLTAQIVPPLAEPRFDQGPVEPGFRLPRMRMMFQQTPEQQAALGRLLKAQRDVSSADYHRWLTPEQYADRFGLNPADFERVTSWLISDGFTIEDKARGRDWIAFSGTAAQVEAVFQASVHRYLVNSETHFSVASAPVIPNEFKSLVATLLGMNDFHPKPMLKPAYTSGGSHSLAPSDIATIYDVNGLYYSGLGGANQQIVIVGQAVGDNSLVSDVQEFRAFFGLEPANIQFLTDNASPPNTQDDIQEADLDLEWAGAVAPQATLIFIYGMDANHLAIDAIDQDLAPIISESFGICEAQAAEEQPSLFFAYETQAQKGNALGITWIAASGDSGAADCDDGETIASHPPAVNFRRASPR
jgi:subtilase family serine protease